MGHRNHGPYAATKGAINQLTKVMAHEYAADGVTVNAVAPGYMETNLTTAYLDAHPAERERLLSAHPGGTVRPARRGRGPGAVPRLAPGELRHRSHPVHRRRPDGRVKGANSQ